LNGVIEIGKRHHRHKRSSESEGELDSKSDGKAGSKGGHKASSRWSRFIEWYLGGSPEEILEYRRVKFMVAIAVAGMIVGVTAIVIHAIWDLEVILEAEGDPQLEEFTFETDTETVMLVVYYSNSDPAPIFIDCFIYRMPAREMVFEKTLMIDRTDQVSENQPFYLIFEYETIDLGSPGRYNITMEVMNDPDSSSYILMVMDIPLSEDFWDVLYWTLIGVFVAMLVLTIAVYSIHRRRTGIYIPLVPFVLTDCFLAVTLFSIYVA
jgi:hypothetical protein